MSYERYRLFLLLLAGVCAAGGASASESIGFSYGDGSYRVNGATVRGNATLFEGARVEMGDSPAKLQLNRGARVWLAAGSRCVVFSDHVQLLGGTGQLNGAPLYSMNTQAVSVTASQPADIVRVMIDADHAALVAPVQGSAQVFSGQGVHVGNVSAGKVVRFEEKPGEQQSVRAAGCVSRREGQFALADRITGISLQLQGSTVANELGHVVQIAGILTTGANRTSRPVVTVTELRRLDSETCDPNSSRTESPQLIASLAMPAGSLNAQLAPKMLNLLVIEGEGAINNIRQRTAREAVVQVEDENHRPVAGALISFSVPGSGPSGTFANGARLLTVATDQQGRATSRGLRPNQTAGQFAITVTASYAGLTAVAKILQTNAIVAAAAGAGAATGAAIGLSSAAKIAIIGGIAATAGTATGLAVALSDSGPATAVSR